MVSVHHLAELVTWVGSLIATIMGFYAYILEISVPTAQVISPTAALTTAISGLILAVGGIITSLYKMHLENRRSDREGADRRLEIELKVREAQWEAGQKANVERHDLANQLNIAIQKAYFQELRIKDLEELGNANRSRIKDLEALSNANLSLTVKTAEVVGVVVPPLPVKILSDLTPAPGSIATIPPPPPPPGSHT